MTTFTPNEHHQFTLEFSLFDKNGDGNITANELSALLKNLGEPSDDQTVQSLLKSIDKDDNGTIDYSEFLAMIAAMRSGDMDNANNFVKIYEKQKALIKVKKNGSILHSYAQEEMSAFAHHLNAVLGNDADLAYLLPIDPSGIALAEKIGDGVLLAKLINLAVPDTIDTRALNMKKPGKKLLSVFEINENLNLVIASAKSIGIQTVNIGSIEIGTGAEHPHLVLGLIWQLVKLELLNSVNLRHCPELIHLLQDGESIEHLRRLPADQLLLRWFNWHLENGKYGKTVKNFSSDLKDATAYSVLLNQIDPRLCEDVRSEGNVLKRARRVIENADRLGVKSFIAESDIISGNSRLNLAFTASIFNTRHGLPPLESELDIEDEGDSREERAFRMWINSLGIRGVYLNNLFNDCADGLVLLKVLDYVKNGVVDWKRVEKCPDNMFKKIANGNYAVEIGKRLGFSLVGIDGVNIVERNEKLILAVVWQLMRYHVIKFLSDLSRDGENVREKEILQWANAMISTRGKVKEIASFKDSSLVNSHYFLELLESVQAGIVREELVTQGGNEEERLLNAKYAITIARKLNCTIFLLPEDIVELKEKMILTFIAAIMMVDMLKK